MDNLTRYCIIFCGLENLKSTFPTLLGFLHCSRYRKIFFKLLRIKHLLLKVTTAHIKGFPKVVVNFYEEICAKPAAFRTLYFCSLAVVPIRIKLEKTRSITKFVSIFIEATQKSIFKFNKHYKRFINFSGPVESASLIFWTLK